MIDMFYHVAVYNLTSYHMAFDRHSLPYDYGPISPGMIILVLCLKNLLNDSLYGTYFNMGLLTRLRNCHLIH